MVARYWTQSLQALRLDATSWRPRRWAPSASSGSGDDDSSVVPLFVRALAARRAGRPADADAALALAEEG